MSAVSIPSSTPERLNSLILPRSNTHTPTRFLFFFHAHATTLLETSPALLPLPRLFSPAAHTTRLVRPKRIGPAAAAAIPVPHAVGQARAPALTPSTFDALFWGRRRAWVLSRRRVRLVFATAAAAAASAQDGSRGRRTGGSAA